MMRLGVVSLLCGGSVDAHRFLFSRSPVAMPQHPVHAPTPRALADLVARCTQINRYLTELTAAEELRIAALASAVVVMRNVLELQPIPADSLPARQSRIAHWALTGRHLAEAETKPIRELGGSLVLDEHDQVKILSQRTWRGRWRLVTLWRDGVHGLSASDLMEYLARLTTLAQQRAPDVARSLLERSQAVEAAQLLVAAREDR
jgi:hypothetical protein